MISMLLLPLLIAGGPGLAPPGARLHDDPPIQLWIGNDRRFFPGERAQVQVRAKDDGYLIIFHVDPEGYLRVLFPLDPNKDNFARGGKKYEVRGRGGRDAFEADARGRGTVYAAVSRDAFRFEGFVLDDHWDYRALAPSRLSSNPEAELNELVRRMAQGNFDYDLLSYEVVERVAYASDYTSRYYGSAYDDPWCYRFSCGNSYYGSPFSLSIGLYFGHPYRRNYYDPYFYAYDPFYSPFFYDPYYYYGPVYYPRYYYRPYYHYPYRDRFDNGYGWGSNSPFPRYRFRGADGSSPMYRDRNVIRRAVNTVYYPPISPLRGPALSNPVRRVVEPQRQEVRQVPGDAGSSRRVIDDARRVLDRPVEAHRARPAEQEPTRASGEPSRSSGEPRLVRREVEGRPSREATPRREEPRQIERAREEPPQIERAREEPRQVERSREEPRQVERPREAPRQVERPAPAPDRGAGRAEGRSSGGGSRPAEGGRRRR